jgi:hypothetical protein
MLDDVLHDGEVDVVVPVDEDVAETRRAREPRGEVFGQDAGSGQEDEELAVRPRLAQASVGNDVGGGVERGLDGRLERVLDEALLLDVVTDHVRPREVPQLADVRLDERQLLGEEIGIGQGTASRGSGRALRYRSRKG